jgi:O-acetyl-ADP-ribose deacetylase (regulator of RNase III)
LARGGDPVKATIQAAKTVVLNAIQEGWSGPPYDPFKLAGHLGVDVIPRDDVQDARLVPLIPGGTRIEFNPGHSQARIRFSVAHELAHTLFRDYPERVHMRGQPHGDDWQLELLCNIAAAEFLMPVGMSEGLEDEAVNLDNLMRLRTKFDVSSEALFLRIVKLTSEPCAVFSAARISAESKPPSFRIDYVLPSRSWHVSIPKGLRVTRSTALSECTAVGFTSRRREAWVDFLPELTVECIGIPAYPGDLFPRVLGILHEVGESPVGPPGLSEVRGDATQPRGPGRKIIAHIVNDRTPVWGPGFARVLRQKWPDAQDDFIEWARNRRTNLTLGNTHSYRISDELSIFHMVAQHGYGQSSKPRIRYEALERCLEQLAESAIERHATVHMPKIGTGQAGGQWGIIRELVDDSLARRGIEVTVYVFPAGRATRGQEVLF